MAEQPSEIQFRPIGPENRPAANAFIRRHWFTEEMILRGERVDLKSAEGFAAYAGDELVGLVTCRFDAKGCEILSLDSTLEGRGLGTALLERVKALARERNAACVRLITTNDNLRALRFYQKRGFRLWALYRDALALSRRMKPEIPLYGDEGIPLRDELELRSGL